MNCLHALSTVLKTPWWPPVVDECTKVRKAGVSDAEISSWYCYGCPFWAKSLYAISLAMFKQKSLLTKRQDARDTLCSAWVLGGLLILTPWRLWFIGGSAIWLDACQFKVSWSSGVSASTALSRESAISLLLREDSLNTLKKQWVWS